METDDSIHAACAINAQSFAKSGASLPSPVRPEENSGDAASDYDEADFEEEASGVQSLEASLEAAASAPSFWEDGEDHIRWERALAGRPVIEMPLEEVLALVRSGAAVPLKHRLVLWPLWIATGNSCTALGSVNVPGSVPLSDEELESLERSVPAEVLRQINLDVSRTLPKWLGAPERAVLRRVLCSLAALQPEVGYCQGLGNIAAVFVVLGFDAATAVAGTRALLTRCCPSYHEPGLPGFRRDAAALAALAQKLLPVDTQRRLAALCIPLEVLATQHLIALASASDWPLCATAQLWDLLLLEGRPALLASFLALLQLYLPEIADVCGSEVQLEPVELFRIHSQQGMARDPAALLQLVQDLLPNLPEALIDQLGQEAAR
ncbi:unnamed protein product [Polarella glacialis]|uniref:Rab-GAP TBC domain-containing protein n=1 Tax=Polarella glacialis TaxID=89957 RepID=A0A813JK74_POLGL|nr:unnamed protein product [Polarella glacialis]